MAKNEIAVKWMVICVAVCSLQGRDASITGAWLQSGVKWVPPPRELQLNERAAEAAILYFGPRNEFAMVYANVIRRSHSETVSHGDGQVVYLGTWKAEGAVLQVEYRLVSRTVSKAGETLPGPPEKTGFELKDRILVSEKMRFNRDRRLDADLRAIYEGESARFAAH
jgi:hypothetical protein